MAMAPLQQFEVHTWIPLSLGGVDISFTNAAFFMVLSVCLPVIFLILALRRRHLIPTSLQSLAEIPLAMIQTMMTDVNGPKGTPFVPFVTAIFLFVFMGNFLGLFPYAFTFTSQFVINFALALVVVGSITVMGLVLQGAKFLRVFCPQGIPLFVAPLLIPIEMISYLTRPLSLSIRLFANMVAGHSMVKIFAYFTVMLGALGIFPLMVNVMLMAFELMVAFLQAYVFAMLSCIYLHDALSTH